MQQQVDEHNEPAEHVTRQRLRGQELCDTQGDGQVHRGKESIISRLAALINSNLKKLNQ